MVRLGETYTGHGMQNTSSKRRARRVRRGKAGKVNKAKEYRHQLEEKSGPVDR